MAETALELIVRTPRAVVFEQPVDSVRLRTDSGQVGLRPRSEPTVLVVEPGLALAHRGQERYFLATAGGLLRCDGVHAVLLTPLGVVGGDAREVEQRLDAALAVPGSEMEIRRVLQRLETGILRELRHDERTRPGVDLG